MRRSLEADVHAAQVAIIAAADTCMHRESADLMAEVFPTVELRRPLSHEALLSIARGRTLLGYEPEHSWIDAT